MSETPVDLVDRFLAEPKHLYGDPPQFGPTVFQRRGAISEAQWPVSDADGIVTQGSLRFFHCIARQFTIALIFSGQCVARLDFVDHAECHSNPHWADSVGLEPLVCGPHIHRWSDNRGFIVFGERRWELPCRAALPTQIRRFPQAFAWLADEINLVLTPDQRAFELPQQLA